MDKKKKLRLVLIMPIVGTMVVLGGILTFVLIAASAGGGAQLHAEHADAETVAGDMAVGDDHVTHDAVGGHVAETTTASDHDMPVPSCEFGFLVGLPVQQAEEQVKPLDRPYRILGPDSMATMDYNPGRINITTDGDGNTVLSVTCG